jgi:hypothetical protein
MTANESYLDALKVNLEELKQRKKVSESRYHDSIAMLDVITLWIKATEREIASLEEMLPKTVTSPMGVSVSLDSRLK